MLKLDKYIFLPRARMAQWLRRVPSPTRDEQSEMLVMGSIPGLVTFFSI
jgi:hypothetical protein